MATSGPAINPIEQFSLSIPSCPFRSPVTISRSPIPRSIWSSRSRSPALLMLIGASGGVGVPGRLQAMAEMAYEFVAGMVRSAAGETRDDVLPAGVLPLHVHPDLQSRRPHSATRSRSRATSSSPFRWRCWCSSPSSSSASKSTACISSSCSCPPACRSTSCRWSWRSRSSRSCRARSAIRCVCSPTCSPATSRSTCSAASSSCCSAPARSIKAIAILPFAMTIGLDALELLVAFLQAYVFAMLTCMYLNDALHPGH